MRHLTYWSIHLARLTRIAWLPIALLAILVLAYSDAEAQTGCKDTDLFCADMTAQAGSQVSYGAFKITSQALQYANLPFDPSYGAISDVNVTDYISQCNKRMGDFSRCFALAGIAVNADAKTVTVSFCGAPGESLAGPIFCSGRGGGTLSNLPGDAIYIKGVEFSWNTRTNKGKEAVKGGLSLVWSEVSSPPSLTNGEIVKLRIPDPGDPTPTTPAAGECDADDLWCTNMTVGTFTTTSVGFAVKDSSTYGSLSSQSFEFNGQKFSIPVLGQIEFLTSKNNGGKGAFIVLGLGLNPLSTAVLKELSDAKLALRIAANADTSPDVYFFPASVDKDSLDRGLVSWKPGSSNHQALDTFDEGSTHLVRITANKDNVPYFPSGTSITDQIHTFNSPITPVTLPTASGGDGTLTHTLYPATLPAGLSIDASTHQITGTPSTSMVATTYSWVVTDSDATKPDSKTLDFDITVKPAKAPTPVATPTDTSVTLSWTPPMDPGTDAWQVRYKSAEGNYGTWNQVNPVESTTNSVTTLSHTLSGLTSGTAYTFQIRAATGALGSETPVYGEASTEVTRAPGAPEPLVEGETALQYEENGTEAVATYTAENFAGESITWSLEGSDAEHFSINSSGVLSFVSSPDREAPIDSDADNTYDIVVTADDDTHTARLAVAITVTDVLEQPTITGPTILSQAENGTEIATYSAPADFDETLKWTTSGDDAALFSISANGALAFNTAPDFEHPGDTGQDNTYDVSIQVSDGVNETGDIDLAVDDTLTVAITVTDVNEVPTITGPAAPKVAENTTDVATYSATTDAGETLAWSISGADADLFSINANSGTLTFESAPDFEQPADSGVDGSYDLEIHVSDELERISGANSAFDATLAVVVTVTDDNEPPEVPEAPDVTSAGANSLFVSWEAPANSGRPAIDDYDVRHCAHSSGCANDSDWTEIDDGNKRTATTITIAGLAENAEYQVQVRAGNDEGDGAWSASGAGTPVRPAGITVSETSLSMVEGGAATYTVVLDSAPSDSVSVALASDDTSVATVSATLTFTDSNWNAPQTVTVTAIEDDRVNADARTASISHRVTSNDANYDELALADIGVTVLDNDTAGISFSETSISLGEGETATYTLALDSEPFDSVSLALASDNPSVARVSETLTFTASNWSTPQTVTVTTIEDHRVNDDLRTVHISHRVTSNDSDYDGLSLTEFEVTVADNDTAGITVSESSIAVGEGLDATYTLVLDSEPYNPVSVALASDDTSVATVSATLTFTTSNWNTAQTVTVSGAEDDRVNAEERTTSISHRITSDDSDYAGFALADMPVAVADNDTAGITVSETSLTTTEGRSVTYRMVLNTRPSGSVSVAIKSNDTSVAAVSGTLIFTDANWSTAQTVTVTGIEDDRVNRSLRNASVSHRVTSTDADFDGLALADIAVTVTDNDTAGVSDYKSLLEVTEGATDTYRVVLASEPHDSVTVALESDDTSIATLSPATLTFTTSNWRAAQTVTVTGVEDDRANRAARTASILHTVTSNDADYDGLRLTDIGVTVLDNDTAGISVSKTSLELVEGGADTYSVALDSEPHDSVSVTLKSNDTSIAALSLAVLTFTASNWNTEQTVTITGVEDTIVNDSARSTWITHRVSSKDTDYSEYTLTKVAVTVADNDTAGFTVSATSVHTTEGEMTAYTLALNTQPTDPVSVALASRDTAIATVSPPMLTFNVSDWSAPQTVTVAGGEDDMVNAQARTTSIGHRVKSVDANYDGYVVGDVAVTVADNDTAGFTVSKSPVKTTEGETATYRLVLNARPWESVSVAFQSNDDTIATVSPSRLTFSALDWNVPQIVTVEGTEDNVVNAEMRTTLIVHTVTSDDSNYDGQVLDDVEVTVDDNDTAGISVSETSLETIEGGMVTYRLVLDTRPSGSVSVAMTSGDATTATLSPATLTFTASHWNSAQTVTVSGAEDDIVNKAPRSTKIAHSVTSDDANYDAYALADVAVTVNDNDTADISVSETSLETTEGGMATYALALSAQPLDEVMVTIKSGDSAIATASPASLTFTTSNWRSEQTVTVTGMQDELVNANGRTTSISHTAASKDATFNGIGIASAQVTVADDDVAAVTPSQTSVQVAEGSSATYTLVLTSKPAADVTVTPSARPSDPVTLPAALTFTPDNWNQAQTLTVIGPDDDAAINLSRTAKISHTVTSADSHYDGLTPEVVSVTVTDDDSGGVDLSKTSLEVLEGETTSYTLTLTTEPSATVTLTVTSSDAGVALVSTGDEQPESNAKLSFSSTDWNLAQKVTVTAVDDSLQNAGRSTSLSHTLSGGGYDGVTVPSVAVSLVDDDKPANLSLSPASTEEGDEGTSRLRFEVSLGEASVRDVSVSWMTQDGTAKAGEDYVAESGTASIPAGSLSASVTIQVSGDRAVEGDETLTLTLTAAHGATLVVSSAVGTIIDDDMVEERSKAAEKVLTNVSQVLATTASTAISGRITTGFNPAANLSTFDKLADFVDSFKPVQQIFTRGDALLLDDKPMLDPGGFSNGDNVGLPGFVPKVGEAGMLGTGADSDTPRNAQRSIDNPAMWFVSRLPREFNVRIKAGGDDEEDITNNWGLWGRMLGGRFDLRTDEVAADGDIQSAYLGVDRLLNENLLVGLALSHSWGGSEVTSAFGGLGSDFDHELTSVLPYASLKTERGDVWGMLGAGKGSLKIEDGAGEVETNLSSALAALGGRRMLESVDTGNWQIALKADVLLSRLTAEAVQEQLAESEADVRRLRTLLEGRLQLNRDDQGGSTGLRVEAGGRWDDGDGVEGAGLEFGLGLTHRLPSSGFEIDAEGRYTLIDQDDRLEEWTLSLGMALDPGIQGHGLRLSLSPVWGDTGAGSMHRLLGDDPDYSQRPVQAVSGLFAADRQHPEDEGFIPSAYEASAGYGWFTEDGRIVDLNATIRRGAWGLDEHRLGLSWMFKRRKLVIPLSLEVFQTSVRGSAPDIGLQLRFGGYVGSH